MWTRRHAKPLSIKHWVKKAETQIVSDDSDYDDVLRILNKGERLKYVRHVLAFTGYTSQPALSSLIILTAKSTIPSPNRYLTVYKRIGFNTSLSWVFLSSLATHTYRVYLSIEKPAREALFGDPQTLSWSCTKMAPMCHRPNGEIRSGINKWY
ncbi:hypothetical protein BY458DRAFT_491751 [Sporodiniella umbellata]|nr:hypothetical protein BY458DRAFT_491751 [Sporodiniella umbellata]